MIRNSGVAGNRRRLLGGALAGGLAALAPWRAGAQAWPAKPLRVIVGFPAGGLTDVLARVYSEHLAQRLGQAVVVENRPGAGSIIACELVAKSAPDGYTFLFTISTAMNQNRVMYRKLPYDPDRDYTYVSGFDAGHLPLAVNASVKAAGMKEFVELARAERVTLGTYAPGSFPHMVAQQLNKLYGTRIEAVHYKGESPMWTDLASGQIHAAIGSYLAMSPHMQAGKIRPIAVPTSNRSPRLPDVPTFEEQGFREPVFLIQGWIGMFGPAGLAPEIVRRLSDLNQEAADTPRVRQINANFGLRDKPWPAEEFERLNRDNVGPLWIALARELGMTLD